MFAGTRCKKQIFGAMISFTALISTMLSSLGSLIVWLLVLIYFVYRWVRNSKTEKTLSGSDDEVENDDGSEVCIYGLPTMHQHCPNCDLVEQCRGVSFREDNDE